jgi:hypothetical protein
VYIKSPLTKTRLEYLFCMSIFFVEPDNLKFLSKKSLSLKYIKYLERYYYSNYLIDILESYTKIIPPSFILDFVHLEVIPENPRLFLVLIIRIKIPNTSNLLVKQTYQIFIRNSRLVVLLKNNIFKKLIYSLSSI